MTSSDSFMKLYNPNTVLLNDRVLIPMHWIRIASEYPIDGPVSIPSETEPYNLYVSVISNNPFERLAACTVLHHMVQLGAVTLTDHGVQQAGVLWIQPIENADIEIDTASNS